MPGTSPHLSEIDPLILPWPPVSLPELIAQTNMDQQSVNRLRDEIVKFIHWLGRNVTRYFVSEYESPTQEYINQVRGSS